MKSVAYIGLTLGSLLAIPPPPASANSQNPYAENNIPNHTHPHHPNASLYDDADGDGIPNYDELTQNSNPFDPASTTPAPFVMRIESSCPNWTNNGVSNLGKNGWIKLYFEQIKSPVALCVSVTCGENPDEWIATWHDVEQAGTPFRISRQQALFGASAKPGARPFLHIEDQALNPEHPQTLRLGAQPHRPAAVPTQP